MKRRTFLARAGAAVFGIPAIMSAGCGGEDGGAAGPDGGDGSFTVTNQDDSGHDHELVVLCADLAAGNMASYTATGAHEHTITLTQAQVIMVAGGESVSITFTDGHTHTFVIAMPEGAC